MATYELGDFKPPLLPLHIQSLIRQLNAVNDAITELKKAKESILYSDAEYAAYLAKYIAHHEDDPLSIIDYYYALAEMDQIDGEINAIPSDQSVPQGWLDRLTELEYITGG